MRRARSERVILDGLSAVMPPGRLLAIMGGQWWGGVAGQAVVAQVEAGRVRQPQTANGT